MTTHVLCSTLEAAERQLLAWLQTTEPKTHGDLLGLISDAEGLLCRLKRMSFMLEGSGAEAGMIDRLKELQRAKGQEWGARRDIAAFIRQLGDIALGEDEHP